MTLAIYKLVRTDFERMAVWLLMLSSGTRQVQKGQKAERGFPPVDTVENDPRVVFCRELAEAQGPTKPSHDLDHVRRVVALSVHIARVEGADLVTVACSAWLHDMERGREDAGGEDHAVAGARMAREVLSRSTDFDREEVEAIADAIASHRFRSGPSPGSIEAKCLFDADKLDALGAVGVGRAYMMAGEHGQRLHSDVEKNASARHVGEIDHSRYSPVEEHTVKLRHLPQRMTTGEGRRLAERRAAFMSSFFKELEAEVEGER